MRSCSPSACLNMVWILVFKLIKLVNVRLVSSSVESHLDILSHACINCKVSVPHTLFTSFSSCYLSGYGGFEVATNPTTLHLLSMDRRTGLLNILQISSQAIEINKFFCGINLGLITEDRKNLIVSCGNAKRSTTEPNLERGLPLEGEESCSVAEAFPQNRWECSRGTEGAEAPGVCLLSHAMCQEELPARSSADSRQ